MSERMAGGSRTVETVMILMGVVGVAVILLVFAWFDRLLSKYPVDLPERRHQQTAAD